MSRVLVVANETVGADELLAELRRIEDRRTSRSTSWSRRRSRSITALDTWNQDGAIVAAAGARRSHDRDPARGGPSGGGPRGRHAPLIGDRGRAHRRSPPTRS